MPDMKTGTTTETLADVLVELSRMAPRRFACRNLEAGYYIRVGHGDHHIISTGSKYVELLIQGACQEECGARGWSYEVSHFDRYHATVMRDEKITVSMDDFNDGITFCRQSPDSPALALATALRDALRAASPTSTEAVERVGS